MCYKFGGKKGAALVTVLVISAVLIILGATLLDYAFYDFKTNIDSQYADYAYISSDSAAQECFDVLHQLCDNPCYVNLKGIYYTPGDEVGCATQIVDRLEEDVNSKIKAIPNPANNEIGKELDLDGNMKATIDSFEFKRIKQVLHFPYMDITIGVTATTTIKPASGYSQQVKKIYAEKVYTVYISREFKLRGPVYTIGDFMTSPCSSVSVNGDVHVYGTSPESLGNPNQYYYGGIFARQGSQITIDGNAYSRSFIRTGDYDDDDLDPATGEATIRIKKDAVAQGIQIFSKNSRIVVYRNAYTFDDMEMNGQDSFIAVNGSYFGLSNGIKHHDDSSALVNTSPLYFDTDAARRSRVVVNGDVLINGGTFRYNSSTGALISTNTVEDAATAWVGNTPLFRLWDPVDTPDYNVWIQDHSYDGIYRSSINGYGNLIQAYKRIGSDPAIPLTDANIDLWLGKIKQAAGKASNDFSYVDNPSVAAIKGFCNNLMAANSRVYFSTVSYGIMPEEVARPTDLKDNFEIDNLTEDPVHDYVSNLAVTDWKSFWNVCLDDSVVFNDPLRFGTGYNAKIKAKCATLKEGLMNQASIFSTRKDYSTVTDITSTTDMKIDNNENSRLFDFLEASLGGIIGSGNPYIINAASLTGGQVQNSGGGYYLLYNDNPERNLILDNIVFNGIIFTNGKVIMKNGSKVNGAIIAAGKGFIDNSGLGYVYGSAAHEYTPGGNNYYFDRAPVVKDDGSNLDVLVNGGYAAIYFEGTGNEINFPVKPGDTNPTGLSCRDYLINDIFYKDENLDLRGIIK